MFVAHTPSVFFGPASGPHGERRSDGDQPFGFDCRFPSRCFVRQAFQPDSGVLCCNYVTEEGPQSILSTASIESGNLERSAQEQPERSWLPQFRESTQQREQFFNDAPGFPRVQRRQIETL